MSVNASITNIDELNAHLQNNVNSKKKQLTLKLEQLYLVQTSCQQFFLQIHPLKLKVEEEKKKNYSE